MCSLSLTAHRARQSAPPEASRAALPHTSCCRAFRPRSQADAPAAEDGGDGDGGAAQSKPRAASSGDGGSKHKGSRARKHGRGKAPTAEEQAEEEQAGDEEEVEDDEVTEEPLSIIGHDLRGKVSVGEVPWAGEGTGRAGPWSAHALRGAERVPCFAAQYWVITRGTANFYDFLFVDMSKVKQLVRSALASRARTTTTTTTSTTRTCSVRAHSLTDSPLCPLRLASRSAPRSPRTAAPAPPTRRTTASTASARACSSCPTSTSATASSSAPTATSAWTPRAAW